MTPADLVALEGGLTDPASVAGHVAREVAERKHSEGEIWRAIDRNADVVQGLVLQVQWMARRQWVQIAAHSVQLALLAWLLLR
jgi:hypothetical protein